MYVQSRMPAEFTKPHHRAPDFSLALIKSEKTNEIESSAPNTGCMHALKLGVRNSIVDNADASIMVAIRQASEGMQQQAVIATINRAMDDDAAIEADRLVRLLGLRKGSALDR